MTKFTVTIREPGGAIVKREIEAHSFSVSIAGGLEFWQTPKPINSLFKVLQLALAPGTWIDCEEVK